MHILDLVMNSIHANASFIRITISETSETISLKIEDNGRGMTDETLKQVVDPFFTTRNTRAVGLGIPLLYQNVKNTAGSFNIDSKINQGTIIKALFNKNHIDCIPLGDVKETLLSLIMVEPNVNYIYKHEKDNQQYVLNTKEIKDILAEVPINHIEVINWLKKDLLQYNKDFKIGLYKGGSKWQN